MFRGIVSFGGATRHSRELGHVPVTWSVDGQAGTRPGPDLAPGESGSLLLPARDWRNGDIIHLTFRGRDGVLIDKYRIAIKAPAADPPPEAPAP